jgi:hypothetical protein
MQIVDRPDDTGRADVDTGVAIPHPIVTGMTRPERVGIELGDCIGRNFFDRRPGRRFAPGVARERTMATENDHGLWVLKRRPSC